MRGNGLSAGAAAGSAEGDQDDKIDRRDVTERSCLFLDDSGSACGGPSEEHVVPRCVGGTWSSQGISCLPCNNALGRDVDPALDESFRRIISRLAPLMPGKLKSRVRDVPSSDGRFRIRESAGGVAELARVQTVLGTDGTPKVFGPVQLIGDVRRRLDALGRADQPLAVGLLLDLVDGPIPADVPMDDQLRRAAFKVVLETLDLFGGLEGFDLARRPQLAAARRFVRTGAMTGHLGRFEFPFVPLTEELEAAFGPHSSAGTLWNRVLISYDREASSLFGLLQIASTMPLGVVLARGVAWPESSMTFLYGKSLLASVPSSVRVFTRDVPIAWDRFRWAEIPLLRSRESAEFAVAKVLDTFREQIGRIQVRLDQDLDEPLGTTLELTVRDERRKSPSAGAGILVGRTCRRVLLGRFANNEISADRWQSIEVAAQGTVETDVSLETATRRQELLRICRALERDLLVEFGLPQPHRLTPVAVRHPEAQ